MSTTWVFLGVIGGREIAVNLCRIKKGKDHKLRAAKLIFRDLGYALLGLVISIVLAAGANEQLKTEILEYLNIF